MNNIQEAYNKMNSKLKVFLGGTCNDSTWRDTLTPMLTTNAFNPVVKDWTPDCQEEERKQRKNCDIVLYTITPKMAGVYSIAEVVDDSNKRPEKTILCVLKSDGESTFTPGQLKSLAEVSKMVESNGGMSFDSLRDVAKEINSRNMGK
jgi:hypothetical protein